MPVKIIYMLRYTQSYNQGTHFITHIHNLKNNYKLPFIGVNNNIISSNVCNNLRKRSIISVSTTVKFLHDKRMKCCL